MAIPQSFTKTAKDHTQSKGTLRSTPAAMTTVLEEGEAEFFQVLVSCVRSMATMDR